MSLAGFKASNHPQQTGKRGAVDAVDDRGTDQAFFDSLSERFGGFTLDVAAAKHNAKCSDYFTVADNGLSQEWLTFDGGVSRAWCNPPYSDCGAWVQKAWGEWFKGNSDLIVMLLPANRTEQGWWQQHVEPFRDGHNLGSPLRVEFLRGRMRFDRPGWTKPAKGDRPPFGCCLLIWESRCAEAEADYCAAVAR